MESKTSWLDDIDGRVVADSFEGSSSESDQEDNKYENKNEAQSKYENGNEGYSTPPGSTITDQKMMMNPASAAADTNAANPKRFREEKVDINESENGIDESSTKRKKAKVALSITSPVVIDVNKPNNKSSSTGITWTDKEEMVILGGLISLKAQNRKYKLKEFYSDIKDRLGQGDSNQVQDKVKSLKRKYVKMQARNQMSFANSHEEKVFILSKIYWGDVKNGETKNTIIDHGDKLKKDVKTLVVLPQPEENSLVVHQQPEENSLVVQRQREENSLVVWQQSEENFLVVQQQPEENSQVVQRQPEENSQVVQRQPEENSLVVQQQPEENSQVVQRQPEENSLVVQRQPEENSLVVQRQPEENSPLVQQQSEENSLVVVQQQSEENSNQIIFKKKEVQVQAQLDKDQKKAKDQKMPKKNPKEKSDQILLDGLRHYLEKESIDSRWVNEYQLATLKNLWNNLQLSKVRHDLAISEFDVELNQRALEVYKEFGYGNDP